MDEKLEKELNKIETNMVAGAPGSPAEMKGKAKFLRLQTEAMLDSAKSSKRSVKIMLATVIILALSSFISLLIQMIIMGSG